MAVERNGGPGRLPGAGRQGAADAPAASARSEEPAVLVTIEDIDREIASLEKQAQRLRNERERRTQLLADPVQQQARRVLRREAMADSLESGVISDAHMRLFASLVRPEHQFMFSDPKVLRSDAWDRVEGGWRLDLARAAPLPSP